MLKGLLVFISLIFAFVANANEGFNSQPNFIKQSLFPTFQATVEGIKITEEADLVLLNKGAMQGFRTGALGQVISGGELIATLIITKTDKNSAIALVLQSYGNKSIAKGQLAKVKTTKL